MKRIEEVPNINLAYIDDLWNQSFVPIDGTTFEMIVFD